MPKPFCLDHRPKIFFFVLAFFLAKGEAMAQITVSGTVYDSTRTIPVGDVTVQSSGGTATVTDSMGHYNISTTVRDSLTFIYRGKPTAKFAVKIIPDIGNFDISIHVRVPEKFQTLKEVRVYTKSYKQDSIENRENYQKIFGYQKPGVSSSINEGTGSVGLDLDEFINIFRFRRNKQLKKMQERLLEQEQENYVKYRFNKTTVKRITHLEGAELDEFMTLYRPDYEFTQMASTVDFYQYILTASYMYKKDLEARKNKATNE